MKVRSNSVRGAVAVAACAVGFFLLAGLWSLPTFHWSSTSGVVGWVSVHQYPKQQESFRFWTAVLGVPLFSWLVVSAVCGRADHQPVLEEAPSPPLRLEPRWRGRGEQGAGRRWLRRGLVYVAAPLLVYLLRYQPSIDRPVDLFHDGEQLGVLNEMLAGGVPYRDIYLQHGLFHDALLPWLGAKLFGPTLAGVRTMRQLVEPCLLVAFYFLALTIFRGHVFTALATSILLLGVEIGPAGRATFGLLSLACLAGGWRWRESPWRPAAAGWLAVLGFWHSVEVGLYTLSAGLLFCLFGGVAQARHVRPLLWYAGGAFVGFWVVGWFFLCHGALDDLVRNVFQQCAYQTAAWGLPFPRWGAEPGAWRWYLAPAALTIAGGWLAWRATTGGFWRSRTAPSLLLLTLAGALFFRTALGRSDESHLHYAEFFGLLLVAFAADHLWGTAWDRWPCRSWRRLAHLGLGLALVAALVGYTASQHRLVGVTLASFHKFGDWPARTTAVAEPLPRAGRVNLDGQETKLAPVIAAIRARTSAEERVFDSSARAAYLFFAERRSATRYFQICYATVPAMQQEIVRDLERQRVRLVLAGGGGFDDVPMEARQPLVAGYLAAHYRRARRSPPGVVLLERF